MSDWRITEWSRDRGRGAVASAHYDRVEFDAAVADVDDFHVGESVCVEIEIEGASVRVRRLWPDLPRFRRPKDAAVAAPLHESLRSEAEAVLQNLERWSQFRVVFTPDRIRIELDDDGFAYGPSAAIEVLVPKYVELPSHASLGYARLAEPAARDDLASRVELTATDVAVTLISEENRFYFVVGRRLAACEVARRR